MVIKRGDRSEAGLGVSEMAVACTVLAIFFVVVSRMVIGTHVTHDRGTRVSRLQSLNQRILDQMQAEVSEAVEVFQQDDIGSELFETLQKPQRAAPIPFTCLPKVLGGTEFGRELSPGARTGNVLMFAKWERRKEITCGEPPEDGEEAPAEEPTRYTVDVYRLVCYYLVSAGAGPSPDSAGGLNLFRFVSEGLADATQLELIEDVDDQLEVMRKLVGDKVTGAWRRDVVAPPDWFVINPGSGTMDSVEFVAEDPQHSDFLLDPRRHAVASNHAHSSLGVGEFGVKTAQQGGFPHGFEVQMMGPAEERELMLHLTLVGARSAPQAEVYADQRLRFVAGR